MHIWIPVRTCFRIQLVPVERPQIWRPCSLLNKWRAAQLTGPVIQTEKFRCANAASLTADLVHHFLLCVFLVSRPCSSDLQSWGFWVVTERIRWWTRGTESVWPLFAWQGEGFSDPKGPWNLCCSLAETAMEVQAAPEGATIWKGSEMCSLSSNKNSL